MKKILLFAIGALMKLLLNIPIQTQAQNLVPNPSFEEYDTCPDNAGQIIKASMWSSATLGSPDYYNTCSSQVWSSLPSNSYGYQNARTGNGYSGIYTYVSSGGNYREYIHIMLNDSLRRNKRYLVQFYASIADSVSYACNELGIFFSEEQLNYPLLQGNLPLLPQLNNDTFNILTDAEGWTLISDTIVANGGENYLTLGNFRADSISSNLFVHNVSLWTNFAYYYIDDINVVLLDTSVSNQGIFPEKSFSVFPNPADRFLQLNIPSTLPTAKVVLMNFSGEIELVIEPENAGNPIDISKFSEGCYFIRIQNTSYSIIKKIIIKH